MLSGPDVGAARSDTSGCERGRVDPHDDPYVASSLEPTLAGEVRVADARIADHVTLTADARLVLELARR